MCACAEIVFRFVCVVRIIKFARCAHRRDLLLLLSYYKMYPEHRVAERCWPENGQSPSERTLLRRVDRTAAWLSYVMTDMQSAWKRRFADSNRCAFYFPRNVVGSLDSTSIRIRRPKVHKQLATGVYTGHKKVVYVVRHLRTSRLMQRAVDALHMHRTML